MELPEEQNKGIVLKEYGRNIQKIVNHILEIEDRDLRGRYARTLIELMKQINPNMRDAQDSHPKLWDHLYIMSNFQLDVETQFPCPEKSVFDKKPMTVDYNMHSLYFKHYGRNVELLIAKAIEKTDPEEIEHSIIYLGRLMKRFYSTWNKENIDDEIIVEHLAKMSKNKLVIPLEKVRAGNLFDSNTKEAREPKLPANNGHNYNNSTVHNAGSNGYYGPAGGSNNGRDNNRKGKNLKDKRKKD